MLRVGRARTGWRQRPSGSRRSWRARGAPGMSCRGSPPPDTETGPRRCSSCSGTARTDPRCCSSSGPRTCARTPGSPRSPAGGSTPRTTGRSPPPCGGPGGDRSGAGRGTVARALPDLWLPPSGYTVTPVIGWWRVPAPVWAADPREVARRSGSPWRTWSTRRTGSRSCTRRATGARLPGRGPARLGLHGWPARPAARPRGLGPALADGA